jgi:hypothetical protein
MNTSSGAEYAYFMDAFGPMPAYLFSWVSTLVLKPSQLAIICLSFAKYAVEAFVSECEPPDSVVKMVAVLAIGGYTPFIHLQGGLQATIITSHASHEISRLTPLYLDVFTKCYYGDKMKEDEMSGACSTHGEMRNAYKF